MSQLHDLSALEQADAVWRREVSPLELTEHYLDRISRLDADIAAFFTVTPELARAQARKAGDVARAATDRRELGRLHGVPTAIKDLNQTRGVRTTMGSAVLRDNVPDLDDHVVVKVQAAGLISLGKTATPEFGLPAYTESDIGPPVVTPWAAGRLAGGSSGGAAAAVAAGFLAVAQGSDGGGSIRIPASACGVVGLKPARGRVSNGPLGADVPGLGAIGPLARTVRDAAAFLDAIAGPMPGDPYWAPPPPPGATFLAACEHAPRRLRIGRYLRAPLVVDVDPEVGQAWEDASHLLESLGHEIVDIDPPLPAEAVESFEIVWSVGAATIPVPPAAEDQLRPLTRWLRERGSRYTGTEYAQALMTLTRLARRAVSETEPYDAVLTPTVAQLPPPVGYFTDAGDPAEDFERQKRYTPWTSAYNLTGQPGISLPLYVGRSPARGGNGPDGGLPIGVLLTGRPAGEQSLLALAAQVEQALPWRRRHPPIWLA